MSRKQEKFIEDYENKIKDLRKDYYNNIYSYNVKSNDSLYIEILLNILPSLCAIILTIVNEFNIKYVTLSIIILLILTVVTNIYISRINKNENKYLKEIRKKGFLSIEDYENKIKEYLTGEDGLYNIKHEKLIKTYNINSKTPIIEDLNKNRFYLTKDDDNLLILNIKNDIKPEIEKIRINDINYFKLDRKKQVTIIKTNNEEKYFNKKSYDILKKYINTKKYSKLDYYNEEEYVDDYERYMYNIKKQINKTNNYNRELKHLYLTNIILLITFLCGFSILTNIKYMNNIFIIIYASIIIEYILLEININEFLDLKTENTKASNIIDEHPECIEKFNELKKSLDVPKKTDKIYSKDKEYLVWIKENYLHIFLNKIDYKVFYISVKEKDITYYQKNNSCILNYKNKNITFDKEAYKTLKRIIPDSSINWLNGLQ